MLFLNRFHRLALHPKFLLHFDLSRISRKSYVHLNPHTLLQKPNIRSHVVSLRSLQNRPPYCNLAEDLDNKVGVEMR